MHASTPTQLHELWTRAFQAGDLSALVALYEPTAVLAPSPTERFEGQEAIREALDHFLALKPTLELKVERVVQAGDVAILFSPWKLVGTDSEGKAVRMESVTADVVRRQVDGSWLMAIDNPFGGR